MTGPAIAAMIKYYNGDIHRVNHSLKVYGFAKAIAECEGLRGDDLAVVELAAVFHDIGIPQSLRIHGTSAGPYQEKEGVAVAGPLLDELGCPEEMAQRIKFIIGNHHSYEVDGGLPLQIIFEADFFVNLEEKGTTDDTRQTVRDKQFRTATGKRLMDSYFSLAGSEQ